MKIKTLFSYIFLFSSSVFLFLLSNPSFLNDEGVGFLSFFAYFPFFVLIKRISFRQAVFAGFFYGLLSYLFLCYWLSEFGLISVLFVIILYGIYYSILAIGTKVIQKYFYFIDFMLVPLFFVLFEAARAKGFLGFSYGIAGYTQWKSAFLLSSAAFWGVYGISFLIYFTNYSLFTLFTNQKRMPKIISCAVLFMLLGLISSLRINQLMKVQKKTETQKITVSLIQNFSSDLSCNINDYEMDVDSLISLTDNALTENSEIQLIVWPETAVVPDISFHLINGNDKKRNEIARKVSSYIAKTEKAFLTGNNHRRLNADGSFSHFNSALFCDAGVNKDRFYFYDKTHLVPFTEELPFFMKGEKLRKLRKLLSSDDYTPGKEPVVFAPVFEDKQAFFGTLICFEDSFPEIAKKYKKMGAQFLVNITDDSWSKSLACQNLHLSMSVLRAAENNLPVVRSSISGQTCVIDRYGNITALLEPFTDGYLTAQIEILR